MNLQKLFETQKILDDKIVKEKGLDGVDLLDKKILALQVELGELANEWRGFKFWSENQEPTTWRERVCHACKGKGSFRTSVYVDTKEDCGYCDGSGFEYQGNPLLEEYVDCLHFILSIGNDLEVEKVEWFTYEYRDLTDLFLTVNKSVNELLIACEGGGDYQLNYSVLISYFDQLGYELGFTWQQIEQAYYDKNKVNHERQANGY